MKRILLLTLLLPSCQNSEPSSAIDEQERYAQTTQAACDHARTQDFELANLRSAMGKPKPRGGDVSSATVVFCKIAAKASLDAADAKITGIGKALK